MDRVLENFNIKNLGEDVFKGGWEKSEKCFNLGFNFNYFIIFMVFLKIIWNYLIYFFLKYKVFRGKDFVLFIVMCLIYNVWYMWMFYNICWIIDLRR